MLAKILTPVLAKFPPHLHEPLRFMLVGGSAAATHLTLLVILVHRLKIAVSYANALAFLGAFVMSFLGHYFVTFQTNQTHATLLQSLPKWLFTSLLGFGLNQLIFIAGIRWLGESYYILVWFIATAIVTILSFILGKVWAFR